VETAPESATHPRTDDLEYTWVDLDACAFQGRVTIEFDPLTEEAAADLREVTLNAVDLAVHSAVLVARGAAPARVRAARWTVEPQRQTLTVEWDDAFPRARPLAVEIAFSGRLNEQLTGFYKSVVSPGRVMGVTQFEPTDARRALPCYDEPARKATFRLTLAADPKYAVLSNTRPAKIELRTGTLPSGATRQEKRWTFHRTPRISTYLYAWVVTDHVVDVLADTSPRTGVETLVHVARGNASKAGFALDCAVRALDFFADAFGVPYPLDIMQHVAVPDFAAGAMENVGCIVYREARLLVDESTTATARRDVARVIAHEISHQVRVERLGKRLPRADARLGLAVVRKPDHDGVVSWPSPTRARLGNSRNAGGTASGSTRGSRASASSRPWKRSSRT